MARFRNPTYYCADFETTVEDDTKAQTQTEVWSSAIVRFYTEDVHVFTNIKDTLDWVIKPVKTNTGLKEQKYVVVYYHNIKFDGSFLIDYFLKHGFTNGFEWGTTYKSKYDLYEGEMSCRISSKGQWYEICVNYKGCLIEFRDSLKLLPFPLKKIGKDFKTKHQKLEMEYKGEHFDEKGNIKKEFLPYIKNDVLVMKEALEFMFSQGHDKLTIGGCCLAEYKRILGEELWNQYFPNLSEMFIDEKMYGSANADEYIRKSYRGGWCYQVKGKEGTHYNGVTCDVNSLYPSVMHSESGSRYPIGKPHFWKGNIPQEALINNRYFFVRIRCRFKIKENRLPWLQIKGNVFYCPTECLTDSDFTYYDKASKSWKKSRYIGNREAKVTLTLTCLDYELFKMQYDVLDEEVLDGCWFESKVGIFDEYINKYAKIKMESTGAMRTLAKLFLNNLYGKLATSPDSSFKVPRLREDGIVTFDTVIERNKETVFIACGSAITSYAKNFTIRTAQNNYYGVDKAGFIYADTDSIHCDISADKLVGVPIHPTKFNHWKVESSWDVAQFVRQKTYIEHVTHEDLKPIDKPYYNVKCAGLPDTCKGVFVNGLLDENFKLSDFKVGLKLDGKLLPRRVMGGIVLTETEFTMH